MPRGIALKRGNKTCFKHVLLIFQMAGDFIKVQNELSELRRRQSMLEEKLKIFDATEAKSERECSEKVVQLQAEKVKATLSMGCAKGCEIMCRSISH